MGSWPSPKAAAQSPRYDSQVPVGPARTTERRTVSPKQEIEAAWLWSFESDIDSAVVLRQRAMLSAHNRRALCTSNSAPKNWFPTSRLPAQPPRGKRSEPLNRFESISGDADHHDPRVCGETYYMGSRSFRSMRKIDARPKRPAPCGSSLPNPLPTFNSG